MGIRVTDEDDQRADLKRRFLFIPGGTITRKDPTSEAWKMAASKQQYVSPYGVGRIYAALRQTEEAFRWLETAYEQRGDWMVFLKVDPVFDDLRSDPRFQDLMRRMNFPQ